jgi:hypothetical protein
MVYVFRPDFIMAESGKPIPAPGPASGTEAAQQAEWEMRQQCS